jgi:hypothetical protein
VVTAVQIIEDDTDNQPAEIRTAIGTLGGLSPAPCATFWFDAHGDCNTPETTTTGFSPEEDHDQGICRATLAAIEAMVRSG